MVVGRAGGRPRCGKAFLSTNARRTEVGVSCDVVFKLVTEALIRPIGAPEGSHAPPESLNHRVGILTAAEAENNG
eukprot:11774951-Alexandrium_andersonii.AAC.1